MSALPGPLALNSAFPFVGRASELVTLRSLVPWAEGEGRRVVIIGGEAGSGKRRLVREFAAAAAEQGALVLYGARDPGGATGRAGAPRGRHPEPGATPPAHGGHRPARRRQPPAAGAARARGRALGR